ncbi:MAG: hypothetical protein A2Z01_11665 [Betaproteobacteria bacterium RBG_16_58_11]|nr:MAG: hypothetical protein A2Z01_11665 [Betaproteobacteria bacterium RBG_16_58_11]
MDLSRVYTKTSKGILDGNTKSRELTREHGRVLALIDGKSSVSDLHEKISRLSESRLGEILDELAELGMIRQLNGALAVDDFGFSSPSSSTNPIPRPSSRRKPISNANCAGRKTMKCASRNKTAPLC